MFCENTHRHTHESHGNHPLFYNFPVNDLQVTRIGRTVSDLRKIEGEVGFAAKALIAKWKSMVVAETISSSESDGDGSNGTSNI